MIIDVLMLAALVTAVIKGFSKGLVVSLLSFIGLVIGAAAAIKLGAMAGLWLQDKGAVAARWAPLLGFVAVFVLVIVAIRLLSGMVEKSVEWVALGWLNRVGGVLFYVLMYGMVCSILLFYATKLGLLSNNLIAASQTYGLVTPMAPAILDVLGQLVPWFKDMFVQLEHFFEGVAQNHAPAAA